MDRLIILLKSLGIASGVTTILYLGFSIIAWDFTWVTQSTKEVTLIRTLLGLSWIGIMFISLIALNTIWKK